MGKLPNIGDPAKVADAMIALAALDHPPRRLTLGSDSYRNIRRALSQGLAELETQEAAAARTDFADPSDRA